MIFFTPKKIVNKISRSHDVNLVFRSFCSFSLTLTMVQNHLVGWLQISKCIKTNAKRWCWCCGAKQLKHIVLLYISVKTVKACQNHHHFDSLWSTSSIKIPSTALWSASVGEASPPLAYQASWGCIDPTWRNLLYPFVLHKIQLLLAAVYDVIDDVESWCKDHQGCKNDANTLNQAIRKHMSLLRCIVSSCRSAAVASLSEFFGSCNYKQKRCKRLQPVQAFRMLRIPACHEEKI